MEAEADNPEHLATGATFAGAGANNENDGDDNMATEEDVDTSDLPPELRMDEYDDDEAMPDEFDNDPIEVLLSKSAQDCIL
jgi:hypothetical protein